MDLESLTEAQPRDLWTLQVKATWVGAQKKPIPSIVFATYLHLIDMDWFLDLRSPELRYGNDKVKAWSFCVTPEEMARVVRAVHTSVATIAPNAGSNPAVSLMFALRESRLGEGGLEILLDRSAAAATTAAIRSSLDKSNGLAISVMDLYRETVFP